jgi:predicted RNA binding protein YcfA (HicA-like mRNA interferase family)
VPKTYRQVEAALRRAGFVLERTTGSHSVWTRGQRSVIVPGGGKRGRTVPTGTLAAIRRQRGLDELR